jgi:predicted dehydrogenase
MKTPLFILVLLLTLFIFPAHAQQKKLRIGIAGLTHSHVHWILNSANRPEFEIVGISEPNRDLATRLLKQYNLPLTLLYPTLEEMLDKARPEAVTAFHSIYNHLAVVKACAPRHIHVMVEKPLAVSNDHAQQMAALAKQYNIHLLTNYETTWYAGHYEAYDMIYRDNRIGKIRKVVVHDGHRGPKEINVNPEFLAWLTDPVENGGGALMDFGCYGADLITWLLKGEKPVSVTAVTQQIKPDVYPKVDDDATIVITYPGTTGVIQASWNWPYNRKDIEIYGQTAYIWADKTSLTFRNGDDAPQQTPMATLPAPMDNPFAYFAAVVNGSIVVKDTDLSSLPLNVTAVEILDAARRSAKEGKTIFLKKK